MTQAGTSSSPGVVFFASLAGGLGLGVGQLALLEILAPHALRSAHSPWAALAGFGSAMFGAIIGGGLWR